VSTKRNRSPPWARKPTELDHRGDWLTATQVHLLFAAWRGTIDEMTRIITVYVLAALAEIGGCFGFWLWLRQDKSPWWLVPAMASLAVFGWLLTLVDTPAAGRAFAAYGGVYIAAALVWLWAVEGVRPDRWDLIGVTICLVGAGVILLGPRTS